MHHHNRCGYRLILGTLGHCHNYTTGTSKTFHFHPNQLINTTRFIQPYTRTFRSSIIKGPSPSWRITTKTTSTFQRLQAHPSRPSHPLTPTPPPVMIVKRTMMAVKTNSGPRGRGMQGWFRPAKKKKQPKVDPKDALRGGNIKYDNKVSNSIKLQICHNEYDAFVIEPDKDDRLFYTHAKFTVKDIQTKLNEVYDDYNEKNIIEYYEADDATWKPLIHINDVLKYRGGKIPFKIRLPQYYDDTPLPTNYLNHVTDQNHSPADLNFIPRYNDQREAYQVNLIGISIKTMILVMKHEGYERSDIKQHVLVHPTHHGEILTRDYILRRAQEDPGLQSLLLNHVHALEHMIEFIHYDFVWKKVRL